MKRMVKQCLFGLMICGMIAATIQAQDESSGSARVSDVPAGLPSASPVFESPDGPPTGYFPMTPVERWFAPRYYVDSRGGTLYGYEESFTNVGAFMPYCVEEDALLCADARSMLSYDGRGVANLGLGWRWYLPDYDRYLGLNTWYDFDAGHVEKYHQVGLGFESIGRYFDLIVNGYIPIGTDSNVISTSLQGPGAFVGNQLLLDRYNEVESAFTGFDANIGGPMPILGRYGLQGYVGFYFFSSAASKTDFTGVSGRLAWQINEDLNLGVNMTDDHVFGTNTQIQVSMTIPDGKASRWLRPLSVRDRMMQSVMRNYRVTVEREIKLSQEAAINPEDNEPYFIVHVDPNVAGAGVAAGNGTVENPFNLLSQFDNMTGKAGVDIIYVSARDDNTSTNLNEGVTLLSSQRLLSDRVPHTFQVAQYPGVDYFLPGLDPIRTGALLPKLSNDSGGDVVTLADGAMMVEVSGFEINGSATGRGITGSNNSMVSINRNVIQGGRDGIYLTNLTGIGDQGSLISSNIVRNNFNDGIFIGNSAAAPLDLVIADNGPVAPILGRPNDIDTDGDAAGVPDAVAAFSLDGDGNFDNDGILNNGGDGIDINADANSTINLLVTRNRIGGESINPDTSAVTSLGNAGDGLRISATANSRINARISEQRPVDIVVGQNADGSLIETQMGYGIQNNGGNGINIIANNSTVDLLNVVPGSGIPELQVLGGGIINNNISANGGNGVNVTSAGNSTVSAGVYGNIIGAAPNASDIADPTDGNAGWGIAFDLNGGTALLALGDADIPPTPDTPGVIFGNDLSYNSIGGIDINAYGNALVSYNIENNRIRNTVTASSAAPRAEVTFSFNGISGTNPFTISNLSDAGIDITNVIWNLNGTPAFIDTDNWDLGLTQATYTGVLAALNGTDLSTGLTQVDGQGVITGGAVLLAAATNTPIGWNDAIIADGDQSVALSFNSFDSGEQFDATLFLSQNGPPSTTNPYPSSVTAGSTVTVQFSNGLSTMFNLERPSSSSQLVTGSGVVLGAVSPGYGAGQDGIRVTGAGTATFNQSSIVNNRVSGYGGFGVNVSTSGASSMQNLLVQGNTLTNNGTGIVNGTDVFSGGGLNITRGGSSNLQALVLQNTITENFNDGIYIGANGTAVGGLGVELDSNTVSGNVSDGVQVLAAGMALVGINSHDNTYSSNNENNWNIRTTENATLLLNIADDTVVSALGTRNTDGDGLHLTADGQSVALVQIAGSNTAADTIFSLNAGDGIDVQATENGYVGFSLTNATVAFNGEDGVGFNRLDASLIQALITDITINNNGDDGIQFYTAGANVLDGTTPLFDIGLGRAPANQLILNNVTVTGQQNANAENGANGLETATLGDSFLLVNATLSSFTNNAADGIRSFAGQSSSYGDRLTGERSTFDGVTLTGNGHDGMRLFAQGADSSTPSMLVEVNSNSGNTLIANNGDDGIESSVPYGDLNLLVNGDTVGIANFNTIIQANGRTSGLNGHGIEFNVGDAAEDGDSTTGANSIAHFFFQNPQNGLDTFQITQSPGLDVMATGTLTVNNTIVGDEDLNDNAQTGNAGDGIHVFGSIVTNYQARFIAGSPNGGTTKSSTVFVPNSRAIVNIDSSDISGNGNDGIAFIGRSGTTDAGVTFDTDNTSDIITPAAQFIASVTNNTIRSNGDDGIDIDLFGRYGQTLLGSPNQHVNGNVFLIDNNVIHRNAGDGMAFQSNAGFQAWAAVDFQDPAIPPPAGVTVRVFNPAIVGADAPYHFNSDTTGHAGAFLDITADAITDMQFTRNDVRFNGTSSTNTGDGVSVRVSTNSYLGLDMGGEVGSSLGNIFSGNALADVRFESFIAYEGTDLSDPSTYVFEVPPASTEGTAPAQDIVRLDHTAQMNLRFNNNTGAEVSAPFAFNPLQAAIYTNNDPNKSTIARRSVQLFQLDGGSFINANNNWGAQDLQSIFEGGNFYLRTINDPTFPNTGFPLNFNDSPFNPFNTP